MRSANDTAIDYTIDLADGRRLAVMEVGDRDGPPVIHCHGHASSRLEILLYEGAARRQGVRLICFDRPGIGRSDPRPDANILTWPEDVAEATSLLNLGRFPVQGMSGGGIYALACAYRLPDRLTACGLISTLATNDQIKEAGPLWMRRIWWIGEHLPWLFWPHLRFKSWLRGTSVKGFEKQVNQYARALGEADREVFAQPGFRTGLGLALTESCRQGREANLAEAFDDFGDWGFELADVTLENIRVWHGDADLLMPASTVRLLVRDLPHCHATFYPGDGHFSIPMRHMDEILATLKAAR